MSTLRIKRDSSYAVISERTLSLSMATEWAKLKMAKHGISQFFPASINSG